MTSNPGFRLGFLLVAAAFAAGAAFAAQDGPVAPSAAGAKPSSAGKAPPPSIADFFRKPAYGRPELSPSGRYLAVIEPIGERFGLGVLDLDGKSASGFKAPYGGGDVLSVTWLTDDRLIVGIGDRNRVAGEPPDEHGVVAANRDGGDVVPISSWGLAFWRVPGSTTIFAMRRWPSYDSPSSSLFRVDTESGRWHRISSRTPGHVTEWYLDFDRAPLAIATADLDGDRSAWYVRKGIDDPWIKVDEAALGELKTFPVQFDASGKILYVRGRRNGEDRASIFEYTIESGLWKEVVTHPTRDVFASFVDDIEARKVLGLRYVDDRPSVAWFDSEYARIQKGVDAALPGMVNVLQHRGERWLVTSSSDRDPGEVYLLDGKTMKMGKLFSYEPQIDPNAMAPMKWVRYLARDGLTIPALLTIPNSAHGKPVPLVVDIHGGPNIPANVWGYDREVQFFASRGYAVLQPQYRGTSGFGWKFESAGFRHWGDTMQNDLADGVKWAVTQGIADPARVCFYGGSYGGYASAWGTIANANLIKCAIDYAGVTSIDYLFDNAQADMSRLAEKDRLMVDRIGDPKTERARFKRVNPVDHADQAGVPLLLAYGASDRRVPLIHGTSFRDALDKYHKPYEWVVYADEGHGFTKDEDVFDFYGRVERFLAKYLGGIATSGKPEGAEAH